MGTGTYATQCRKYFGDMAIEGVEIDGALLTIYFDVDYLNWIHFKY